VGSGKTKDPETGFNNTMKKRIGMQGSIVFLTIVVSVIFSKFLFPSWKRGAIDGFLDTVGIGIILLGFLFRVSARGYKSENSDNGKTLVTDGPYRLMRHPMYFGTLLIGMGVILALFEWWAFPLFCTVFLLIYVPEVRKEEKQLAERFDGKYKEYAKRTPNYFPRGLSVLKLDISSYLFFKLEWLRKEIFSVCMVMALVLAAETWEDVRLLGHIEYFKEFIQLLLVTLFIFFIFSVFYREKGFKKK